MVRRRIGLHNKKEPGPERTGFFFSGTTGRKNYWAVVFSQYFRVKVVDPMTAEDVVVVASPTVVEGNHGGANPPLPNR